MGLFTADFLCPMLIGLFKVINKWSLGAVVLFPSFLFICNSRFCFQDIPIICKTN